MQALHLRQLRADEGLRLLAVLVGHAVADRVPDLGVGQALVRVHDRFVELRVRDVTGAVDLHVADETQPVDFRFQRADAVGQRLRQHRHDEAGEVDRRGALGGLFVERRSRAHVVRDVGDRDHQAEAFAIGLAIHRVVEILGVLAVDRDQWQLAQVDARRGRCSIHFQRHGGRLRRALRAGIRAGSRGRGSPLPPPATP